MSLPSDDATPARGSTPAAGGERDLALLLRSLRPVLEDGLFLFCTLEPGQPRPGGLDPLMTFREREGTTLVLRREEAEAVGLAGAFPCRLITLDVRSALDAVGFLAVVTRRLADEGMSVNPVAAFHHDHLLVPADRADDAMRALRELAASAPG